MDLTTMATPDGRLLNKSNHLKFCVITSCSVPGDLERELEHATTTLSSKSPLERIRLGTFYLNSENVLAFMNHKNKVKGEQKKKRGRKDRGPK